VLQNGDAGLEHDAALPPVAEVPVEVTGACGTRAAFGPTLTLATLGTAEGAYDGPAIVERSSSAALTLYFQPSTPVTDAGADTGADSSTDTGADSSTDAGAASSRLPVHVSISGHNPVPLFPLGAHVWLSKDPIVDPEQPKLGDLFGPQPWSFSVRDRAGGRLLFGAARGSSSNVLSAIPVDHVTPDCELTLPCSLTNGTAIYSRLDVHGDVTVSIADSETAIVPIGGFDYEVRVSAREESFNRYCEPGRSPNDGVAVEFQAKDLESLIASLETGELPACVEGNSNMLVSAVTSDLATYTGRVLYQSRSLTSGYECFTFATEQATTAAGDPLLLTFCVFEGLFPEPSAGQEFWATIPNWDMGALREPQQGALLLGYAGLSSPFTGEQASQVEATLGVRVSVSERCPYLTSGNEPTFSLDTVFETEPPLRLRSRSQAVARIGERDYDAWAYGLGAHASFGLIAR
jgi:hypothetical protein